MVLKTIPLVIERVYRLEKHEAVVDWLTVVSASALAVVLSLLTSMAGLPEVKNNLNKL